ncbi:coagulation factor 5/8 type domain protein (plasmid) [Gemmatirosa kalamazoonensis]|uniref:Coagulation factor 5/8 type domain protein n=1 Tax=Gemmatirosa kalamazoonensis TaxID=861299 RepID=W0RV66_9BACT|nr:discoidin domain-containing protein [Gemmatirosa kalamazoonensis]AHG93483.1 coagulation factor 5/8 type domain protein [Gemmatirosa kalamazoonensis]
MPRLAPRSPTTIAVLLGTIALHTASAQQEPPVRPNGGRPIAPITDTTTKEPAIVPVSPREEQQRFVLQPGWRIDPVLTEPDIAEPAAIAFDGNGRMFVLELRTYMQDADATGELAPGGRISVHEDADNDGVYEKHTVFVDGLVFPRFVLPWGKNAVLTMESNADEVWKYTDTDGDGKADRKELFTTRYGRSGNVEHQQAFLTWAMDNWLYSTYNAFRIRPTPNGMLREPTGPNGAQWGVTQDDDGKVWFQGGASGVPSYFQFPIVYGAFKVPDELAPGFKEPFGLAGVGDFQPGPTASRADGTLKEVTGSAGNDVVRGHRMPNDLLGDYLYGEPVARIVRRIHPVVTEGLTQLHNVYQPERAEFVRSIDPLFRPTDMATAPDGTVYVVDMYRGIIQESQWTPRGSHIRAKIEQYGLERAIGRGRIWRLSFEALPRDTTRPRMLDETPAQLVTHLRHPNGWWRDMAQQLLVLKGDRSVAPALRDIVRRDTMLVARFHALWTLEGLGALDAPLVRAALADPSPRMRVQAIRASETLYKAGDTTFAARWRALARDPSVDVALQAMMTLATLKVRGAADVARATMAANPARGVQVVGAQLLAPPPARVTNGNGAALTVAEAALVARGDTVFTELCSQCHGEGGRGVRTADGRLVAPMLAGSPRVQGHRDYVVKTLLRGLTGPIDGRTYQGALMAPMGDHDDAWIAAVASYVRLALGNRATPVTTRDVARVRAATAARRTPWTYAELAASMPVELRPQPTWKATASHNAERARGAFDYAGWTSGAAQAAGMWLQVELPAPALLTELQFESPTARVAVPNAGRDAPTPLTYPRAYRVELSSDGATWSTAVAGEGTGAITSVSFAPTRARFVRITLTGDGADAPETPAGTVWGIQQLRLWGPARR